MRGTIRQRLTVAVVSVTAVMLALLVLGFNLSLRSSLDGDVDRLLQARAQATLESIDIEDGKLEASEGSDDGVEDALVWVFADGKALESPQISGRLDQVAASLAAEGEGERDDPGSDTRLRAEPVVQDGQVVGTVITGLSLEPYERTADRATAASIVLALVMLALITVATRLVVGRALKPVSEMTEEAANWSEHDLDRRFNEGEPTDELTRLAATFDTMLDRMAYMVRHERNFSAELSHELRTPLSAISAEAEIALRKNRETGEYRESLERISERASELTRVLETLLDVARSEGSMSTDESAYLGQSIDTAISAARTIADRYGIVIELDRPADDLRIQVASDTFQRMVSPILENAVTYATGRVSVSVARRGTRPVEVVIADDGPGFTPEDLAAAFEPGHRGSAARNGQAPAGTGLGLALARRLARANGGDVTISEESPTGATVLLSVPLALDQT
jgi:signal transduction histidine kinase